MALIENSFGGIDLLATVKKQDEAITALQATPVSDALEPRVKALEDELTALRNAMGPFTAKE